MRSHNAQRRALASALAPFAEKPSPIQIEVKKVTVVKKNGGECQSQRNQNNARHLDADFCTMKKVLIAVVLFLFTAPRFGQGAQRQWRIVSRSDRPVAGASIRPCESGSNQSSSFVQPCTIVNMYSSSPPDSKHLVTQPLISDGFGSYIHYAVFENHFKRVSFLPDTISPLVVPCPTISATTGCESSRGLAGNASELQINRSGHFARIVTSAVNVGVSSNIPVKLASTDYLFYVSSNGTDSNDGKSWGTAFKTLYHALAACPFNGGCVYYLSPGATGYITIGGPVSGQGIWLTSNNDYYFNGITAISRSGNVVTAALSANGHGTNFWSVGQAVDVFNVTGGRTSFDGTGFKITASGGNAISWTQPGENESGTVSHSSYLVPTGFLYASKLQVIGTIGQVAGPTSTWSAQVNLVGNSTTRTTLPGIWISDNATPIHFENLLIGGARALQLGVSSAGDSSKGDGVSAVTFKNVSFVTSGYSGVGPTVWIAGNSFEDYFHDCLAQANTNGTPPGSDAAAAILIKVPANGLGQGAQSDYLSFWNIHLNYGGIKYYQGASSVGSIYIDGLVSEALPSGTPAVWFPAGGANASMIMQGTVKNVLLADSLGPTPAVEVDIPQNPNLVTVEETQGSGVDVVGPLTILGSQYQLGISALAPEWAGQVGIWGTTGSTQTPLLIGRREDVQRSFSPVAARFQNLASTSSSGWLTSGNPTITSGVSDPDGNANAYHVAAKRNAYIQPYSHSITPNVGDWVYFGGWVRSTTGNIFHNGYVSWRIDCTKINSFEHFNNRSMAGEPVAPVDYAGTTEWHYYSGFFKITAVGKGVCTMTLSMDVDASHSVDIYAPMLIYVPAGTMLSDNELATYFSYLAPYGDKAPVGSIAGIPGQTLAITGATQFYGLLTHSNTVNQTYTFPDASGTIAIQNQPLAGSTYSTASNCSSSSSPAVCGSSAAGSVVIAAGATSVTVETKAVTANSQIFVQVDDTLGAKLDVTCNSTLSTMTGAKCHLEDGRN